MTAFSFTKRSEKASGIGVDISAEMLQSATARFSGSAGFRFLKPDENIEPGSCDLTFRTETLEHVGDAAAVLRHSLAHIVARRPPADRLPFLASGRLPTARSFGSAVERMNSHEGSFPF